MRILTRQHLDDRRRAGRAAVAAAAREHVENLERRVMLSTVTLNTTHTYQTIKGFGGDYAEGYFNTYATDPLGTYDMQNLAPRQVRVPILLQDWAPTQGGTYSDTGEVTQEFQLMQQAQAAGAQVVASVWTVPDWMVTNPSSTNNRILNSSLYGQISSAIGAWLLQAKNTYNVNVSDVSFNEPDGGFTVSLSSAQLDQLIDVSGPVFQSDGVSTKWMVGDTSQIDGSAAFIAPILADATARQYINAIAVHAWNSEYAPPAEFQAIANLGTEYNLPVWSTETNFGPSNLGNFGTWNSASQVAQTYLDVIGSAQASVVDYWEYQNDQPLVGAFNSPYPTFYVVQQFEQYLTVGSQIVQSSSSDNNIQVVAGQNGQNFTLEALNANSADTPTTITGLPNGTYSLITTDGSENAAVTTPIVVSNGSVTITLPAGSFDTLTTLSPLSPPAQPTGAGTGLQGVYFKNADANGFFSALVNPAYSEVDPTVNFNWGEAAPSSSLTGGNFSVQWTGSVQAQYTQTYTFTTVSDGGVQLFVNGQEIINDYSQHTATTDTGAINLVAGQKYAVTLNYYQENDYALMALGWQSASTPLETIPSTLLYPTTPTGSGSGLLGQYFINSGSNPPSPFPTSATITRVDPTIDFNWTNSSPDSSIPQTSYAAQWTGTIVPQYSQTYTFTTTSDDGARLWVNGVELVNDWNIQGSAANSGTISLVAGTSYSIVLQYFQGTGNASVDLQWQSASTPLQDVPTSQLYPATGTPPTPPTVSVSEISPVASIDQISGDTTAAIFQFTRNNTNLSAPLTVDYTMTGTAVSGVDYLPLTGVVTFATGYTTATVNLVSEGDSFPGSVLTATATIMPSSAYSIGTASSTVSIDEPPVAPTTLTAVASTGQITLNWAAVAGATSYNIYRSTVAGGEGTSPFLAGIAGTSFVDPSVTGGATYYYTVTAVTGQSEGNTSPEASATATSGAGGSSPLADGDIGYPGLAGSASYSNGVYELSGSGSDIWNAYDQFNFDSTSVPGNAVMVVQVTSQTVSDPWAKAGLMFRDSTGAGAANFAVVATPGNGISVQWRSADGGSSAYANTSGISTPVVPVWLEIVRSGNVFTAFYSLQSVTNPAQVIWTQVGSPQTIAMGSALAGLAVTSHNNSSLSTATFGNLSITGSGVLPAAPAALTATPVPSAVNLSWAAVPGALYYDIFRGTLAGQESTTPVYSNVTATAYPDTAVNVGTTYYYTVEAVNAAGTSGTSPEATAAPLPATGPATLTATAGVGQIVLSWSPVNGATGYDVYRSTTLGTEPSLATYTGISATGYTDSAVTTGTPYYYTVTAIEAGVQSAASTQASATATLPPTPATLTATPGIAQIVLSWSAVPGASGYDIYRAALPGGEGSLATYTGISATTYTDTALTTASPYYYTVTAVENGLQSTRSSEATATATPAAGPATLTATPGVDAITLSWSPVAGATGYSIYRASAAGAEASPALVSRWTATTYSDTTITPGSPYYYVVTATVPSGSTSNSPEATAIATPAAPAMVTATSAAGQIVLSWSAVAGAVDYNIYRSNTPGGEGSLATYPALSTTSYTDSAVSASTPYYYTVTALEGVSESPQSTEATAAASQLAGPAALTATPAVDAVNLSWAAVAGATGYSIYRGSGPGGESAVALASGLTNTTYPDAAAAPGTTYYYFVTATVASGSTSASPEASATAIPAAPTGLTATGGIAQVVLSWTPVPGATRYDIYRGTTPAGEGSVATYTDVTNANYTDTNLTAGVPYYYTVTAVEGGAQSGQSTEATAAATATTGPATLTATPAVGAIDLTWSAVSGAVSYSIYSGAAPGQESSTPLATGITTTSYPDTAAVPPGTDYYYVVVASMTTGPSLPSPEAFAAALPAAPATLAATGAAGQIALSWAPVAGATSYDVYKSPAPGGEGSLATFTGISATSYTDTAVAVSTPEYYTVTAVEGVAQSPQSTETTASATAVAGPATLAAVAGTGRITLSWSAVPGATGYSIYRSATPGGELPPALASGLTGTTYPDTTGTPGATYYYIVTATVPSGSSASSPEAFAAALPAAPASLTAIGSAGQIALSWAAVAGVSGYDLYKSAAPGTLGTLLTAATGSAATSYTDTAVIAGAPYYYTVTAVETGVQSVASTQASAAASAVAGPATLTATAATGSITLSWAAVAGATGYSIYRGTSPGGEGAIALASGLTATTYPDSPATPGTTYYYEVTATVASGSSASSPEAHAAALPAAPATLTATGGVEQIVLTWASVPGASGYDLYKSGTLGTLGTLITATTGSSATSYTDSAVTVGTPYFYTVAAVETGVQSLPTSQATAAATGPAAPATLTATPGASQIVLAWSAVAGATSYDIYKSSTPGGEGTIATFTGITAATYTDSAVSTSSPTYYTVTAVENGVQSAQSTQATATATAPAGGALTDANISSPGLPGTTSFAGNVYTVSGGGADFYGNSDQGNFAYQPVSASSITLITQITSQTATDPWAKAGLMMRDSVAAGAAEFAVVATPGNGVEMQYRLSDGAATSYATALAGSAVPVWLEIVDVGGVFNAYYSTQTTSNPASVTWTTLGSPQTIHMPTVLAGLAVTAHNNASLSTATFANYSLTTGTVTTISGPTLTDVDISSSPAGSASLTSGIYTVSGGGSDIYGNADSFNYDYTAVSGNATGIVQVDSQTNTNSWAKAGLMFRDSTGAGAANFSVVDTPGNGIELNWRLADNAATSYTTVLGGTVQLSWLEIVRVGNVFTAFYSTQATTTEANVVWTQLSLSQTIAMPTSSLVGLAVCSHNTATLSTATFGNLAINTAGAVTAPAAPATLTATVGIGQITLSWAAVSGATGYDLYKSSTPGGEGTVATYSGVTATTYTDTAVSTAGPTYYTVTAVEGGVQSSQSTQAFATATAPASPATLTATAGVGQIALSWAAVSGATGYNIYKSSTSGGEGTLATFTGISATTYTDTAVRTSAPTYYTVTALENGAQSVQSTQASATATAPVAPSAPSTLTATAGIGQIVLSWSAVPGATGYDIYKSSVSGGEGTLATFTGLTATTYTDTAVSTSAPTYYTVTAVQNGVQSVQSTQATATATAPAGGTLTDANIGGPGITGTTSSSNGVYTVSGGGSDIYGSADQFNFAYTAASTAATSLTLVTRVTAQTATDPWAKAGLMFRDSVAAGGAEFAVVATPGNGVELQWRLADNGATSYTTALAGNAVPVWLEIVKVGNAFTAFYSTQTTTNAASVTWTAIGTSQNISMSALYAGLAVTAHNNASLSTASFASFSLNTGTSTTVTSPTLTDSDIGSVGLAGSGSSTATNGTYTVTGAGSDIYGTADSFNYDYASVAGSTTAVVQVSSLSGSTDPWAKAGLMFRDSAAAGGAEFSVVDTVGNGIELNYRTADGGATTYSTMLGPAGVVPSWLEIVRVGNVFTAFYSTQSTNNPANVTWTVLGSPITIAMPTTALAGLVVNSHNPATLSTATFTNLSL